MDPTAWDQAAVDAKASPAIGAFRAYSVTHIFCVVYSLRRMDIAVKGSEVTGSPLLVVALTPADVGIPETEEGMVVR